MGEAAREGAGRGKKAVRGPKRRQQGSAEGPAAGWTLEQETRGGWSTGLNRQPAGQRELREVRWDPAHRVRPGGALSQSASRAACRPLVALPGNAGASGDTAMALEWGCQCRATPGKGSAPSLSGPLQGRRMPEPRSRLPSGLCLCWGTKDTLWPRQWGTDWCLRCLRQGRQTCSHSSTESHTGHLGSQPSPHPAGGAWGGGAAGWTRSPDMGLQPGGAGLLGFPCAWTVGWMLQPPSEASLGNSSFLAR